MSPTLPPRETLTVEFKSDRKRLSDTDLVEAIVCLANGEGGELWLGVEDDGTPTGLHANHQLLAGLAGLVAARTSPSLTVQAEALEIGNVRVARIDVPKAHGEVATSGGVYTRQAGFSALQNEQMVLNYVHQHGQIKRAEVMGLCRLSEDQAKALLKRLRAEERLLQNGERRGSFYTLDPKAHPA